LGLSHSVDSRIRAYPRLELPRALELRNRHLKRRGARHRDDAKRHARRDRARRFT